MEKKFVKIRTSMPHRAGKSIMVTDSDVVKFDENLEAVVEESALERIRNNDGSITVEGEVEMKSSEMSEIEKDLNSLPKSDLLDICAKAGIAKSRYSNMGVEKLVKFIVANIDFTDNSGEDGSPDLGYGDNSGLGDEDPDKE